MNPPAPTPSLPYRTRFVRAFECVADRRYGPWFGAQILSSSGGMTQSVAAAWLVYRSTHNPTLLALLSTAMMLPVLVGSAWAGTLADHHDRRRILLLTQTGFAVIGAVLAGSAAAGVLSVGLLYAATAMTGIVLALDGPARQVYVLDLVGRERLASAVSLYEVVINAARIVGPAVGGLLLAVYGPATCFGFNAACYLPAIVVLGAHGRMGVVTTALQHGRRAPGSIRAGLRYAFGTPLIRSCLVLAGLSGILFNTSVFFPLLATHAYHVGADGYGFLIAAFGIGALPGALLAATTSWRQDGRLVGVLAAVTGAAMVLAACAPTATLAYVAMAATGFAAIWFVAVANTVVQLMSAPTLRGRVMGAWTMMLPGTAPLTGLLVASYIDVAGARIAFATTGFLIAVAALGPVLAARSIERRMHDGTHRDERTMTLAD